MGCRLKINCTHLAFQKIMSNFTNFLPYTLKGEGGGDSHHINAQYEYRHINTEILRKINILIKILSLVCHL